MANIFLPDYGTFYAVFRFFFVLQIQREADCHVESVQSCLFEIDFGDFDHVVVEEVCEPLKEAQVYDKIPVH